MAARGQLRARRATRLRVVDVVAFCAAALLLQCGPSLGQPGKESGPIVPRPPGSPPVAAAAEPVELTISELKVDPARMVRIKGVIASIVTIQHVPAKVVFKLSDSKETITVLINRQLRLEVGTRVELVGRYAEIPSPTRGGHGEPPRQAVFEVERISDVR
jgi:hypothetical protein